MKSLIICVCVWAAPSSGLAALPPLPRSWLEDFHAVCYLAVDRWTTSRTVPGTERTHHQPGQSPLHAAAGPGKADVARNLQGLLEAVRCQGYNEASFVHSGRTSRLIFINGSWFKRRILSASLSLSSGRHFHIQTEAQPPGQGGEPGAAGPIAGPRRRCAGG